MKRPIIAAAAALLFLLPAGAQESARESLLLSGAANLCREYRFEEAARTLGEVLSSLSDTTRRGEIEKLLAEAENGLSMSRFCSSPVPVAKGRFSLKDFFLAYPLEDRAWRSIPNPLDSIGGAPVSAVYVPEGAEELYFSATGEGGRDIFRTENLGDVWSAPEAVLPLRGDEVFPMLSPDGKSLYFSSKGLFGMGGYDLYVSHLEDGQWSEPENLGIPYSSPGDDLLFYSDGVHSFFASNRDCAADSVVVYVLEYDALPVKKAVSSAAELRALARLEPARRSNGGKAAADPRVESYLEAVRETELMRSEIEQASARRDLLGQKSSLGSEEEKELSLLEARIRDLQQALLDKMVALSETETALLLDGVSVDPNTAHGNSTASREWTFPRRSLGKPFSIKVLPPEPKEDFRLSIGSEGRFVEDNTLPDGLVYQVQFLTLSKQATVAQLKGVGPVFWRKNGAYISHYAGLFRSYDEALQAQAAVRKAGFPKAFVVALSNGKSVTVAQARSIEKSSRELCQIRIRPADGKALSEKERSVISALVGKDLARVVEEGEVYYLLGPFEDRREADLAASGLRSAGLTSADVESVK